MAGVIVKIDGIDGSGKGTLVENLRKHYDKKLRVTTTREFGNDQDKQVSANGESGTVSRILCEIALNPRLEFDLIEKTLMLGVVERRQNRMVLPALRAQYDLILSDRSSLSTAYSFALGDTYKPFLEWTLEPVLEEDAVLWIDIDPKIAFKRTLHNTEFVLEKYEEDLIEVQGLEFQIAVSEAYKKLATERKNVTRLDGTLGVEELAAAAIKEIDRILERV